ncbi:hypothetical protein [Ensifer sp. ENS02]|uniref:hypothetical protein n=1 Tax=Ensifer sp. ENS02 TaxID=2769290 RepID=UPI001FEDF515|nr:hypothetical protein [Ensifer sp. ENS02]
MLDLSGGDGAENITQTVRIAIPAIGTQRTQVVRAEAGIALDRPAMTREKHRWRRRLRCCAAAMPSSHTDIAPASLPSSQSDTPDQTFDYEGFHFFLLDTRSERMQRKVGAGLANATLFKTGVGETMGDLETWLLKNGAKFIASRRGHDRRRAASQAGPALGT